MNDILPTIIEQLQEKGAAYVEARHQKSDGTSLVMKNGIVDGLGKDSHEGIGVRFLYKGRMGFFSTNATERSKILSQLHNAFLEAKRLPSLGKKLTLSEEKPHVTSYRVTQKQKLDTVDIKEKIEYLRSLYSSITDRTKAVKTSLLSYSDSTTRQHLMTSEGTSIRSTIPQVSLFYMNSLQVGSRTAQRNWEYGACGGFEQVKKWNLHETLHTETTTLASNLQKSQRIKPQQLDVVCDPQVVGIMVHESAGHPYEADRILGREAAQAGESFINQGMIGSRIGSDKVTVVDDPRIPNSYGFFKYDNEGVQARENVLIKDGIINGFLHNRETSAAMGLDQSNGCSRASNYDKESIVRMSNTYLKKGDQSTEELIEDVKDGIYLKNYMEWNIDDKRLSQKYVGAECYSIKNGRIQEALYNPILEVTTPKLWSSVDGLGKKVEFHAGNCGKGEPMQGMPVMFGGPAMRLRQMRIR